MLERRWWCWGSAVCLCIYVCVFVLHETLHETTPCVVGVPETAQTTALRSALAEAPLGDQATMTAIWTMLLDHKEVLRSSVYGNRGRYLSTQREDVERLAAAHAARDQGGPRVGGCVIVRGEHAYLQEWLVYHAVVVGLDHIYVYDNAERDGWDHADVVAPFVDAGIVTRIPWSEADVRDPSSTAQLASYEDCATRARENDLPWVTMHDGDEFIVLRDPSLSLRGILASLPDDAASLVLNWRVYLFNQRWRVPPPEMLAVEAFAAPGWGLPNKHIKSVSRTTAVTNCPSPHTCAFKPGFAPYSLSGQRLDKTSAFHKPSPDAQAVGHIAHLLTRSWEDNVLKRLRGMARNNDDLVEPLSLAGRFGIPHPRTPDPPEPAVVAAMSLRRVRQVLGLPGGPP